MTENTMHSSESDSVCKLCVLYVVYHLLFLFPLLLFDRFSSSLTLDGNFMICHHLRIWTPSQTSLFPNTIYLTSWTSSMCLQLFEDHSVSNLLWPIHSSDTDLLLIPLF